MSTGLPAAVHARIADILATPHVRVTRVDRGHSKYVWMVTEHHRRWYVTRLGRQERIVYRSRLRLPLPVLQSVVVRDGEPYGILVEVPGTPLRSLLDEALPAVRRLQLARLYGRLAASIHCVRDVPGLRFMRAGDWLQMLSSEVRGHTLLREAVATLGMRVPDDETYALTHGDLAAEHVYVQGEAVTGVIDWEWASISNPALDLGYRLPRGDAYWGATGAVAACLEAYVDAGGAYRLDDVAWYAVFRRAMTLVAALRGEPRLLQKQWRIEARLAEALDFRRKAMSGAPMAGWEPQCQRPQPA